MNVGVYRLVLRGLARVCGVVTVRRGAPDERLCARRLTALALGMAGSLALCASVAQAEPPKLIFYGSFNSVTSNPIGIAVDQSSGDLYVAGFLNQSAAPIDKFDAAGKPISPPLPFGENFNVGLVINPTNGDLDALNAFGSINTYNPDSGAPEPGGSFPVTLPGEVFSFALQPPQIAADPAGDVYVPDPFKETSPGSGVYEPNDEIHEYSPSGVLLNTFTGEGTLKQPSAVALDSSGDLWVADSGKNRIEELSPADVPLREIRSDGVQNLALDGHGDVLAIVSNEEDFCGTIAPPCAHLVEYSSTGAKVADVGAGSFETGTDSLFRLLPVVAVDESSGRVYVTDGSHQVVWMYGAPAAPVVGKELTAEVTTSEAKLGALVNPGGIQTTYSFEYGTSTDYGNSTPVPAGSVGEGVSSQAVWAAASGLAPGTTYHYHVTATNELGTVVGPDQTFTTSTVEHAACSNEGVRSGFSARLPDCRAYELVTPPTKTSVESREGGLPAANGDAVAFLVNDPLPGAPAGSDYYLAGRGGGGWGSEVVVPLESYSEVTCENDQKGPLEYSTELSKAVIEHGQETRASSPEQLLETQSCNAEGLQVVPGEPVGYKNLLLRDNATGSYRLINATPAGVTPADAQFKWASADLSHVVFTEEAPLAAGARYGAENLYEWDEGVVRLLSVLPNGAPVVGSFPEVLSGANVISAEGSHILFTYGDGLYERIDGERTVQLDESQGLGASGGGSFGAASTDGQEVFFTDADRLTSDSTAEAGEPDLYECALPEGASKCELTDLTVARAGEHADVMRVSALGSGEGSYVYFTARGVLASNEREYTDAEGRTIVEEAESGQKNLYVWHEGVTTFIATLDLVDHGFGQVSPDGTWFAFESIKSLTGYDNATAVGLPLEEVFLYNAASNQLACASCNPSGEAPTHFSPDGGANMANIEADAAPRYLSDGGRLFFQTGEALVPSDTNGQLDVYEYEDGRVYLISSGTSSRESTFTGASEDGGDVFFRSSQALVPQDNQEGMDALYDARIEGGFPVVASPSPCATADACRTPVSPQPSIYGAPSSQTFSGAGNLVPSVPSAVKPKALTRTQKRVRALTACRKSYRHSKERRVACERKARGTYGPVKKTGKNAMFHKGGK